MTQDISYSASCTIETQGRSSHGPFHTILVFVPLKPLFDDVSIELEAICREQFGPQEGRCVKYIDFLGL